VSTQKSTSRSDGQTIGNVTAYGIRALGEPRRDTADRPWKLECSRLAERPPLDERAVAHEAHGLVERGEQ
jgi:hypothetical protein